MWAQVRVMPLMEDQISSLQSENKHLYHLLSRLTEDDQSRGMPVVNGGLQVEGDENVRTFRGEQGSILVELPLKIGKEESDRSSSYSMQSTTETRTEVRETNASARRAFFWGTAEANDMSRLSPESLRLFKPSRTIGVGDGNVFDMGVALEWPAWRKTRDVGVHCLPPSRDVSVSVSEATGEDQLEDYNEARVNLTVTVSDERRACEPRWEVERFGTGIFQDVAIQCLIIGGFLPSDRPHMSENVDGWLIETDRLWTGSLVDEFEPLSLSPTRSESVPKDERRTISADYLIPEVGSTQEQSVSAVKVERQSASIDNVFSKLYQTKADAEVDGFIREEKAVLARANPSVFDLNESFRKLQETAEVQDQVVKEDVIVAQSKPRVSRSYTGKVDGPATFDLNSSYRKLQEGIELQDEVVKEEVIVPHSKPKVSSACTGSMAGSSAVDVSLSKLQEVREPTIEEDMIIAKCAAPRASSRHVENLPMERLVVKSSDLMVETKGETVVRETESFVDREEKESSVDSTDEKRPFPPHLSRITASSVSDDDGLSELQYDVATHSITVVGTTDSSQPDTVAVEKSEVFISPDLTQISAVSETGMVVTKMEIRRELTEVITSGSEVKTEVTMSATETVSSSHIASVDAETTEVLPQDFTDASCRAVSEVGEVQPFLDEVGGVSESVPETADVSKCEQVPVSSQETEDTTRHTETAIVTAEVDDLRQPQDVVVSAAEVENVTGCHVIITETCVERQLIGSECDQSQQPVVIVPEDTVTR